jgi:imidazolonepropionase-like amidohydrolase
MADLGISNSDVLKISTANAADLMAMEDRGQIREGAFADMLIVSGNPLEDISAVADRGNHRSVVKNGSLVQFN